MPTDDPYTTLVNSRTSRGLQQAGLQPIPDETTNALFKLNELAKGSEQANPQDTSLIDWLMKLLFK